MTIRRPARRVVRVVIYVRGTGEEMTKQLQWCNELCARRQYAVVGIARDAGDGVAWVDAQLLKRSGLADRIIVYSTDVVPMPDLESTTGEIPNHRLPSGRSARLHRIRPLKRDGGA